MQTLQTIYENVMCYHCVVWFVAVSGGVQNTKEKSGGKGNVWYVKSHAGFC